LTDRRWISIESITCELCGGKETKPFAKAQDLYSANVYAVVECAQCGLIYVNPRISNFEEIYRNQETMLKYFLEKVSSDLTAFKLPLSLIERFKPKGLVLDIGCGIGNFLLQLKEKGYECFGIELNKDCVRYAGEVRGLTIKEGRIEDIDFGEERFDLITILSTLEHMGHPVKVLSKVRSLLRDDGVVIISVPNVGYLSFRIGKALHIRTKTLDPTAHLFYFSPATLLKMGEKAGLKMIYHECGLVSSVRVKERVKDWIKRIVFPLTNRLEWGSTITMVLKETR